MYIVYEKDAVNWEFDVLFFSELKDAINDFNDRRKTCKRIKPEVYEIRLSKYRTQFIYTDGGELCTEIIVAELVDVKG